MNLFSSSHIKEAAGIFLIAAAIGLIVNLFHPNNIQITVKRPSLQFAPDTVLAQDLPGVSITQDGVGQTNQQQQVHEPLLITTAQVIQLQSSGQAIIIDARTEQEFFNAHIPGAENIPSKHVSEYKAKLDSLPQEKWLVCYCDGDPCDQAGLLASELVAAGYPLVAVYFDGLNGWKKSGYEIKKTLDFGNATNQK